MLYFDVDEQQQLMTEWNSELSSLTDEQLAESFDASDRCIYRDEMQLLEDLIESMPRFKVSLLWT